MAITEEQALVCLASDDLIGLGMEADAVRRTLHPEGVVTYCLTQSAEVTVMTFGKGETLRDRVSRLAHIRAEQEKHREIAAFRLIASAVLKPEDPTAVEYLKTLAVARIMLDNVANIEASLETQGLKVLQMALRFGANDAGVIESGAEENIRRVIRGAGYMPVERDPEYCLCYLV